MSLEKMNYDAASGRVIYRPRMYLGLKRNFQVMAGAEWLELLCKHIPDRYEQLVRYCGWYSSRSRGARAARTAVSTNAASTVTEALRRHVPSLTPALSRAAEIGDRPRLSAEIGDRPRLLHTVKVVCPLFMFLIY